MANQLSKAETYYIISNPEGLSVEALAKELGRTKNTVQKILNKHLAENPPQKEVVEVPLGTRIDNEFGRREKNGHIIATVMTPGAASKADETRSERQRTKDALKNCVHQCKKKT